MDPAHAGPLPRCLPQLLFKRWQFDLQKSPPSVAARSTPRLEPAADPLMEERRWFPCRPYRQPETILGPVAKEETRQPWHQPGSESREDLVRLLSNRQW